MISFLGKKTTEEEIFLLIYKEKREIFEK